MTFNVNNLNKASSIQPDDQDVIMEDAPGAIQQAERARRRALSQEGDLLVSQRPRRLLDAHYFETLTAPSEDFRQSEVVDAIQSLSWGCFTVNGIRGMLLALQPFPPHVQVLENILSRCADLEPAAALSLCGGFPKTFIATNPKCHFAFQTRVTQLLIGQMEGTTVLRPGTSLLRDWVQIVDPSYDRIARIFFELLTPPISGARAKEWNRFLYQRWRETGLLPENEEQQKQFQQALRMYLFDPKELLKSSTFFKASSLPFFKTSYLAFGYSHSSSDDSIKELFLDFYSLPLFCPWTNFGLGFSFELELICRALESHQLTEDIAKTAYKRLKEFADLGLDIDRGKLFRILKNLDPQPQINWSLLYLSKFIVYTCAAPTQDDLTIFSKKFSASPSWELLLLLIPLKNFPVYWPAIKHLYVYPKVERKKLTELLEQQLESLFLMMVYHPEIFPRDGVKNFLKSNCLREKGKILECVYHSIPVPTESFDSEDVEVESVYSLFNKYGTSLKLTRPFTLEGCQLMIDDDIANCAPLLVWVGPEMAAQLVASKIRPYNDKYKLLFLKDALSRGLDVLNEIDLQTLQAFTKLPDDSGWITPLETLGMVAARYSTPKRPFKLNDQLYQWIRRKLVNHPPRIYIESLFRANEQLKAAGNPSLLSIEKLP